MGSAFSNPYVDPLSTCITKTLDLLEATVHSGNISSSRALARFYIDWITMAGLASRKGDMMLSNGSSDAAGNGYTWGGNSSVLHHGFDITDIRRDGIENSLRAELLQKLQPEAGAEKQMPTLLLYNEAGLRLFEDITYLEEYYLTNAEIEVLERYADAIAERIRPGSIMMELGSG